MSGDREHESSGQSSEDFDWDHLEHSIDSDGDPFVDPGLQEVLEVIPEIQKKYAGAVIQDDDGDPILPEGANEVLEICNKNVSHIVSTIAYVRSLTSHDGESDDGPLGSQEVVCEFFGFIYVTRDEDLLVAYEIEVPIDEQGIAVPAKDIDQDIVYETVRLFALPDVVQLDTTITHGSHANAWLKAMTPDIVDDIDMAILSSGDDKYSVKALASLSSLAIDGRSVGNGKWLQHQFISAVETYTGALLEVNPYLPYRVDTERGVECYMMDSDDAQSDGPGADGLKDRLISIERVELSPEDDADEQNDVFIFHAVGLLHDNLSGIESIPVSIPLKELSNIRSIQ